ncbi:MAG: FAD-dependent oxidoreductase [Verrucomicrobiaceae bacterium]|nr:MAG: FAD-dependent oxidoreductase [Verrucomicrobiaceae bacterium]
MKPDSGRFDVAVIGGGSAGLAAAISAARNGARTLLVERHGCLGGMGTASLVHTFCGLYLLREEPGAVIANPGFCEEIATLMTQATGRGPLRMGRLDVLPQHPVEFVGIADGLIASEPLIELRLHTVVTGVSRDADGWEIRLAGCAGAHVVRARSLVDASGDAVVADFLGGAFSIAPPLSLQRPAYVFGVHGPVALDEELRLRTAGLLVEGVRSGALHAAALGLSFRNSGRPCEFFGTLDLDGGDAAADYDPLDPACLGRLETHGRAIAASAVRWLCGHDAHWRGSYISHWPVRAGIRESRRWLGGYTLTGDDLASGRRFEDEIALATWPMEFRETAKGPKLRYPQDNRPAGIPLRCLKPAGIGRLFVAGRCISADHEAQASIRVMGTCFATGEAAGRAAAKAASSP